MSQQERDESTLPGSPLLGAEDSPSLLQGQFPEAIAPNFFLKMSPTLSSVQVHSLPKELAAPQALPESPQVTGISPRLPGSMGSSALGIHVETSAWLHEAALRMSATEREAETY